MPILYGDDSMMRSKDDIWTDIVCDLDDSYAVVCTVQQCFSDLLCGEVKETTNSDKHFHL